MLGLANTLIVVYKDEMLVNQLRKLIQSGDSARSVPIHIVPWPEKIWLAQKKTGDIGDKILFLGDIRDTDKLIPVIDVKFEEHGAQFGWAGSQAILSADARAVRDRQDYLALIKALADLPVPEKLKQPLNAKLDEPAKQEAARQKPAENNAAPLIKAVADGFHKGMETAGRAVALAAEKAGDLLRNKNAVRQQILFYGVVSICRGALDEFMNA